MVLIMVKIHILDKKEINLRRVLKHLFKKLVCQIILCLHTIQSIFTNVNLVISLHFKNANAITNHFVKHEGREYPCKKDPFCLLTFKSTIGLRHHIEAHHTSNEYTAT